LQRTTSVPEQHAALLFHQRPLSAPLRRLLNVFVGDSDSNVVEVPAQVRQSLQKVLEGLNEKACQNATSAISMSNLTAAVRRFGLDRGIACGANMQVGPAHHTSCN